MNRAKRDSARAVRRGPDNFGGGAGVAFCAFPYEKHSRKRLTTLRPLGILCTPCLCFRQGNANSVDDQTTDWRHHNGRKEEDRCKETREEGRQEGGAEEGAKKPAKKAAPKKAAKKAAPKKKSGAEAQAERGVHEGR